MEKLTSISSSSREAHPPFNNETRAGYSGKEALRSRSANRFLARAGNRNERHTAAESVIQVDDRSRIYDTELMPWRMICALEISCLFGTGIGTGWLAGPKTIITAGHCVFSNSDLGGWAEEITLFPGRDGDEKPFGPVTSHRFSSLDKWVLDENPDFDIGCIHLDEPIGEELGWFAFGSLNDSDLRGQSANISGYPAEPSRGLGQEQWFHSNPIIRTSRQSLYYQTDTSAGQSGGPVFICKDDVSNPLVVGVHAYGVGRTPAGSFYSEANSSPRISPEVFEQINNWIDADSQ